MKKYSLNDITLEHFKDAMAASLGAGHNSIAPLGMSGGTYMLHGEGRIEQVSIRLYCGNPELLITNKSKSFLFYGRFDIRMGLENVAKEYFRIFELLKDLIPQENKTDTEIVINKNAHETVGFDMLNAYMKEQTK